LFSFSSKTKKKERKKENNPKQCCFSTVLLLPCACRGREEEDFKSLFPAILLLYLSTPLA
jgi:hypothetical protein